MKAYKVEVWKQVPRHDGELHWVHSWKKIYHCVNKKTARKKADNDIQEGEWIRKIECIGTVRKIVEVRWEYTPLKHKRYDPEY